MVRAVSPRSVAHMVAQCPLRTARGPGRGVWSSVSRVAVATWLCALRRLRRWEPYGNRCDVFINHITSIDHVSVRFLHGQCTRARDGLGAGRPRRGGAFLRAQCAQSARIRPRARPLIISTRAPLLLVAQRRGLPYLTYADRRAKLARPNLSLTWFSTGCEALAAVATFRVNMRSSVSRRATS